MEALALRNAIEDGKAGAHEEQQARLNMKNDPAMRDDEW